MASKVNLEEVVPEVRAWKEEASASLNPWKIDAWREWAPRWLIPELFEEAAVMRVESTQQGVEKKSLEERVEEVKKKFQRKQNEVVESMSNGEIDAEEAVRKAWDLERELDREIEKEKDFEQWEKGGDVEEEVIEMSPEEVRQSKAREKGKGKEVEKSKETTRSGLRSRTVEDKEEEKEEEKEEDEVVELVVAPIGWRPPLGSTVRNSFCYLGFVLSWYLFSAIFVKRTRTRRASFRRRVFGVKHARRSVRSVDGKGKALGG